MGRIGIISFIVTLLLLCESTRGQRQFTITESNETVVVGDIAVVGTNIRFEDGPCRDVFTVKDNGVISTIRGIDRESNFIKTNADEDSRLSCIIAYLTNDGNNNTIRIEVTIADVNDNAPEFANLTAISVNENTGPGRTITSLTVKDADMGSNGTVDNVYIMVNDSGVGYQFVNIMTERSDGLLTVTLFTSDRAIDYEMYQELNLTFIATDRGTPPRTSTGVLTINVVNKNDHAPVFNLTLYTFNDTSNTSPIGTSIGEVSATDDDIGVFGVIFYSITLVTDTDDASCRDGDGLFAINSTTGMLYLNQSADGIECTYNIRVQAYDGKSASPANVHIRIVASGLVFTQEEGGNVIDYIFNDTFTEGQNKEYTWIVVGAKTYHEPQFNGEGPDYEVSIYPSINFVVFVLLNVDREKTPLISGTLVVSTDTNPPLTGSLSFSLTVLDINDNFPVFKETNFTVLENKPIGTEIGVVVADDPDEGENATVSYTMLSPSEPEGLITLHSNGSLVVNSMIDFEQVERIEVHVRAEDGGTPPMYQDAVIYVDVINDNDNSPVFLDENLTQLILTSELLPVTWYVTANDNDNGEFGVVTYRKVVTSAPNDASEFVYLVEHSGQLAITQFPPPSSIPYQLVVEAVDGGNNYTRVTVTIMVWTDFCETNPCANGGTCTNIDNDYRCNCTEDYGGKNCTILKNPCDNLSVNPCRNNGVCTNTDDQLDYRCSCEDSYSGRNCTYNTVSFKPRSFQKYGLPGISAASGYLHVSMQVAPNSLDGMLLYVGGDDYISMGLENGQVVVRTPAREVTDNTLVTTDGIWYLITVIKSGIELSTNVTTWSSSNNVESSSDQITDERQMDGTLNTVFIGGLSADLTIPYEHSKSRDYIGCMRDFFINGNRIQLLGEGQRRLESYNVVRGCNLDQSRLCGAECTSEGCIDFLLDSDPVCDCILSPASCTADAVPTMVGFTGQANLIVETQKDFFIATQGSRHKLQATEPNVKQTVGFSFRTTTVEAVLLSATIKNTDNMNLKVFWFGNNSLNYDIYEGNTRCGHASVTGHFSDGNLFTNVQLIVGDNGTVTLAIDDGKNTTTETMNCQSNLFVEFPSSTITVTGSPVMGSPINLPQNDFHGCISDLTVDEVTVPLAKEFQSDLVTLQEEGSVNEVHDQCEVDTESIKGNEDEGPFLDLYILVIIGVGLIIFLVAFGVVAVWVVRKCLHHRPNKSRFDMAQDMPEDCQDSPLNTLNFRKKTEFDNASVGHYQEEGEEAMPDATAISIDSLRKSACNSSNSGTGSSAETGFHTGSERDHTSDAGYPEPITSMVNDETPSEVQESEYSTFISDSDITSAVEQTLSPLDVQLLGSPSVLGIPPQGRSMVRKPSPIVKNPALPPMERKISPFHPHSRFSMSTIESGSETSLGPPHPDPLLAYPHPSSIPPHVPGLKTLCGPDFNPISYWEQQSRLKPSIDPDCSLQRLSLASGRGTEDPSSTVSVASTLEEQHEFASQGGGEGEATNMRDGLESDHEVELNYRLADLQIPEYESMTLSQSTLVGGSEEYFPDATIKPCHTLVPVHDNSISSNSPYSMPDYRHSPPSVASSSYNKNPHQRLLSEQDLSTHDRYYERSRTGASKPSHMISDHRLHAQYSTTSTTSSASTPQTRAWRSDDPINV